MKHSELSVKKATPLEASDKTRTMVSPSVDIFEDDDLLTLVADLPGVSRDNMELGIDKNILTIQGHLGEENQGKALYREFGNLGYHRRFNLPDNLELDQTRAELKDGVLTLTFPKAAAAKPRRIEVTVH